MANAQPGNSGKSKMPHGRTWSFVVTYSETVNEWSTVGDEIRVKLAEDGNVEAFAYGLDLAKQRGWGAQCKERSQHLHILVVFKTPVSGKEVFEKTFVPAEVSAKRVLQVEQWINHIHTLIAESKVGLFDPKESGTKHFDRVVNTQSEGRLAKRRKVFRSEETVSDNVVRRTQVIIWARSIWCDSYRWKYVMLPRRQKSLRV